MRFLRRADGATTRVGICVIRKTMNVDPILLRIERSKLKWLSRVSNVPKKVDKANPASFTHRKAAQVSNKDQVA